MKTRRIVATLLSLFIVFSGFSEEEEASAADTQTLPKKNKTFFDEALKETYKLESSYDLKDDMIRIELFKRPGTFNIYCRQPGELPTALFSTKNLSSTTQFLLKIDEKIYALAKSSGLKKELRSLEDGAQFVYSFDDNIRFYIDFSLKASRPGKERDIVQVKLMLLNNGKLPHNVDLKGIFDTVCGEGSSVHFTTAGNSKIRYETQFSAKELKKERAFITSNGVTSFQFVLDAATVSPVENVLFANIDEIYKMKWDSVCRKGRGFSNVRGYDNSGVMIEWPKFTVSPGEKKEILFYIAVAANAEPPYGLAYADRQEIPQAEILPEETPVVEFEKTEPIPEEKTQPVENEDKRTDVEFELSPIKEYQLDPAYIQSLIDQIDSLQSSDNVDKNEILRLNAELDAILEILRKK